MATREGQPKACWGCEPPVTLDRDVPKPHRHETYRALQRSGAQGTRASAAGDALLHKPTPRAIRAGGDVFQKQLREAPRAGSDGSRR